ncbi:homocysteine S-methyltransferase family protein [Microbacterium sp. 5K110]|uniref:homocysteine S-methyltransferase family protein n=1 Tax=unclassified Microbacterium TaxID=2609290 RepID=UPI0025A4ACE4|nr:homocysteine S-methyltransferase family protein [Microbacterium sp. 5K110]
MRRCWRACCGCSPPARPTRRNRPRRTAARPRRRVAAGARLVGGCCRSTPADIAAFAAALS